VSINTIFLDMDDVLADFIRGALEIHGITREEFIAQHDGSWSIVSTLGLSEEEFWLPIIEAGQSFWQELKLTKHATELMQWVTDQKLDYYILTSPVSTPQCYAGKYLWLQEFLGPAFNCYVPTVHKHLLAKPGTLLIDDSPSICRTFRDGGGFAIQYPTRYNSLSWFSCQPVKFVSHIVDSYTE